MDAIATIPSLKETFIFKGGTALRKTYFRHYRYSEDLDFTLRKAMTSEEIQKSIESALEYLKKEYNADFAIKNFNSKSYFTDVKVQFVGLKGNKNTIAIDLSPDEIIVNQPQQRAVFNPYYEKVFSVATYSLEEIAAEKMRSLLQRTRARDYYDLWYVLVNKSGELDKKKIKKIFLEKIKYKKIAFTGEMQFFEPGKIEQARAYYEVQIGGQIKELPPFDKINESLKRVIKSLGL